jgi:hypothetical protein
MGVLPKKQGFLFIQNIMFKVEKEGTRNTTSSSEFSERSFLRIDAVHDPLPRTDDGKQIFLHHHNF